MDLNLASCSAGTMELIHANLLDSLPDTHSGFGPHICSPDTTKGNEKQLFTSVSQTGEEIIVLLLVELGLPSPECLDETTIPDILPRGPVSQEISRVISSQTE